MSIVDLLPEIERRLTTVRDHVMYIDSGELNSTAIAILKTDVAHLVAVLNIIVGYLAEHETHIGDAND